MKQKASQTFHPSSFIIHPLIWYRRRDSNPHCLVSKTSASCPLGYAGKEVQRPMSKVQRQIHRHWTLDIGRWTVTGGPGTI
jgi:hypothetical protein